MNNRDDDDDNQAFLPADHVLYEKLQRKITAQLTDDHERVDLELQDGEENLKNIEKNKEEVGIRLYSVQQQLAENQMNFEEAHKNYNLVQKLRLESEQKLKQENETYQQKKKEVDDLRKKFIKSQDELSKLTRTLIEIDQYSVQISGQIQQTQTTTFTAEKNVKLLEIQKQKQDLLIDSMNEEVKRLQEQKTILTAQLMSQRKETEEAQEILKDAHLEMQKIIASKKNLLERWQKSLMTMQKMDTALQSIKDALSQQNEDNISIGTELKGVYQEIDKESDTSDQLLMKQKNLEAESANLNEESQKLQEEQEKLKAQIALLTKSLHTTEEQAKQAEKDKKSIEGEMNQIETNIMKLHTETKKLYEDLVHAKSEHTTIEKTAANLKKQANLIAMDIEDKNVELENLQNEIVRVKIDQLNTQSSIELLEAKRKEVVKEKEQNELTVIVYETQIRTGHDLNEKKQHEVGRLNKQHDELMSNQSDTSRNQQEAKKDALKKHTKELKDACEQMQRQWIKKQEELVQKTEKAENFDSEVDGFKTKQIILEQKKHRLNDQYVGHEKEIREIQNDLKNLQNDMNKLNDALYENRAKKQKLENENYNIQSEFVEKLKELEKESVKLEIEIDRLKDEKANLLSDIIEAERQILLWERKIQLEKEMQEALDPTVGQSEISSLKKEIHRMELRLDELRKRQETLINEMERTVDKRETIQLKYQNKGKNTKNFGAKKNINKQPENQAQIHKQISQQKQTLSQTTQNSNQAEQKVQQMREQLAQVKNQIDDALLRQSEGQNQIEVLNTDLVTKKIENMLINYDKGYKKKVSDYINKLIASQPLRRQQNVEHLREKFVRDNQNVQRIVQILFEQFPKYYQILEPLQQAIEEVLPKLEYEEEGYEGQQQQPEEYEQEQQPEQYDQQEGEEVEEQQQ